MKYRITSRHGVDMGTFEADTPLEALNILAREAGYPDHEAICRVLDQDITDWTTSVSRFQEGNVNLLVMAVE